MMAVAPCWSTSYVLGWRLRALHVGQLLVDGEAARMEEGQGASSRLSIATFPSGSYRPGSILGSFAAVHRRSPMRNDRLSSENGMYEARRTPEPGTEKR